MLRCIYFLAGLRRVKLSPKLEAEVEMGAVYELATCWFRCVREDKEVAVSVRGVLRVWRVCVPASCWSMLSILLKCRHVFRAHHGRASDPLAILFVFRSFSCCSLT